MARTPILTGGERLRRAAEQLLDCADAWDILAAFNALPPPSRALRFAHAVADAAAFGDTPADAIARFRAGLTRATSTATISAAEARACAAIAAAPTITAKRAAAAAFWPA